MDDQEMFVHVHDAYDDLNVLVEAQVDLGLGRQLQDQVCIEQCPERSLQG